MVLRIVGGVVRILVRRGHLVGLGRHHQAVHLFDAPAFARKLNRQPVEELGVGGWVTHHTEVVERGDDAASEVMVPDPVHEHTCGQRVPLGGQPLREREAPAGRAPVGPGNFRRRIAVGRDLDETRRHHRSQVERVAADEKVTRRNLVPSRPLVQVAAGLVRWHSARGTADDLVAGPVRGESVVSVGYDVGHGRSFRPLPAHCGDAIAQHPPSGGVFRRQRRAHTPSGHTQ